MLLGSATFDVIDPDSAVVGYLVGSAGLHHTHDRRISYSYNQRVLFGGKFRIGLDASP